MQAHRIAICDNSGQIVPFFYPHQTSDGFYKSLKPFPYGDKKRSSNWIETPSFRQRNPNIQTYLFKTLFTQKADTAYDERHGNGLQPFETWNNVIRDSNASFGFCVEALMSLDFTVALQNYYDGMYFLAPPWCHDFFYGTDGYIIKEELQAGRKHFHVWPIDFTTLDPNEPHSSKKINRCLNNPPRRKIRLFDDLGQRLQGKVTCYNVMPIFINIPRINLEAVNRKCKSKAQLIDFLGSNIDLEKILKVNQDAARKYKFPPYASALFRYLMKK